jgi:hypothetical protein
MYNQWVFTSTSSFHCDVKSRQNVTMDEHLNKNYVYLQIDSKHIEEKVRV